VSAVYTTSEVAKLLGLTSAMIRVLVARGQLKPERLVGRAYVFDPREVRRLEQKRKRDKRTKRKKP
jgi:excisionase family DNA binding protein